MAFKVTVHGSRCEKCILMMVVLLTMIAGPSMASGSEGDVGPDVVVYDLHDTMYQGEYMGTRAYSVGTESCNRGDTDLNWYPSTNQHPVIAQNLYRITAPAPATPPDLPEHGKIEMLGMSWLKHGFYSVNGSACGTCQYPGTGYELGVGCSDPYSAWLNGDQNGLGPRSEVNAFTGYFLYEPELVPTGNSDLAGRIQVKESELVDQPITSTFFVEGQYVTPDDATSGNGMNNASHRQVVLSGNNLSLTGPTEDGRPAIYAWQDADLSVVVREVVVPGEGLFVVAYKVGDNGDSTWHYEYAVFNMNSHLSGRSFSVPIPAGAAITNTSFHDVDYHSGEPYDGTDWSVEIDQLAGRVSWFTEEYTTNENANALRWSTMYNFSFDANRPPGSTLADIGLFRDGGPPSVSAFVHGPVNPLFVDGFETGDTGEWSEVFPQF